mmetsp:Transcript_48848/g.97805  ORF Transcript_48848/g.97805 Transcript_48848/m.97805 type:complete len:94 (+) Transcript_48848:100-381(+)
MRMDEAMNINGIHQFGLDIKEVRQHIREATKEFKRMQEAGPDVAPVKKEEGGKEGRKSPVIPPARAAGKSEGKGKAGVGRRGLGGLGRKGLGR